MKLTNAIWFAIGFLLPFLLMFATSVHAMDTQPAPTATESEHLFFLETLIVYIVGLFILLLGMSHGYAVTRKHDEVNV